MADKEKKDFIAMPHDSLDKKARLATTKSQLRRRGDNIVAYEVHELI